MFSPYYQQQQQQAQQLLLEPEENQNADLLMSTASFFKNVELPFPKPEDLINGLNEWRNIQNIVRVTFKSLCEVVQQQAVQIKFQQDEMKRLQHKLGDHEKYIKERASKSELALEITKALKGML